LFFCQGVKPRFKTEDRLLNTSTHVDDCLDLMRKLIEYRRQKALHHQLMKAAERSMLGVDAIVMLYHCAKVSVGHILEVGSYVGAAQPSPWPWGSAIQAQKRNHQYRARSARASSQRTTGKFYRFPLF
jgi:hypothetical protein